MRLLQVDFLKCKHSMRFGLLAADFELSTCGVKMAGAAISPYEPIQRLEKSANSIWRLSRIFCLRFDFRIDIYCLAWRWNVSLYAIFFGVWHAAHSPKTYQFPKSKDKSISWHRMRVAASHRHRLESMLGMCAC